jgi:hypothetical protein
MNRPFAILLLIAAAAIFAKSAKAEDTNSGPVVMDQKYFEIISKRNIFDPTRTGRRQTVAPVRAPRVDSFTLSGIMSYEKGDYAFFDGSSSEYRKSLQQGQTIAGYKIAEIKPDHVSLQASSNKLVRLNVGTQMRRREGGKWAYSGRVDASLDSSPAQPDTGTAPGAPSVPGSGPESDILKRLMMQRLKEK